MSLHNISYMVPLKEAINLSGLIPNLTITSMAPLEQQICYDTNNTTLEMFEEEIEDNANIIYQVIYPEDLDLKPQLNVNREPQQVNSKRGRPKRKIILEEEKPALEIIEPPKTARTRSGRIVRLPKHIEKDFKNIVISEDPLEVITTEFVSCEENNIDVKIEHQKLEKHQRKRNIPGQYRCPKCQKAYLGKAKMIQHLKKNPDHGPLSEKFKNCDFDVWNYLVDVTQRAPTGSRGMKFCQELTNLLHNLQVLTSALFKKTDGEGVEIDKVLGNSIGLQPGKYKFDESELYKDVTMLKLISNENFFNLNNQNTIQQEKTKSKAKVKVKIENENFFNLNNQNTVMKQEKTKSKIKIKIEKPKETVEETKKPVCYFNSEPAKAPVIEFQTDVALEDFSFTSDDLGGFSKKIDHSRMDLMSENSLLAIPHEFISVSSTLLDNSIGSDDVMNVDQFVNERFKKFTEPDLDLNLDINSLDLFHFASS